VFFQFVFFYSVTNKHPKSDLVINDNLFLELVKKTPFNNLTTYNSHEYNQATLIQNSYFFDDCFSKTKEFCNEIFFWLNLFWNNVKFHTKEMLVLVYFELLNHAFYP